jgi:hypothetical protein
MKFKSLINFNEASFYTKHLKLTYRVKTTPFTQELRKVLTYYIKGEKNDIK